MSYNEIIMHTLLGGGPCNPTQYNPYTMHPYLQIAIIFTIICSFLS